MKNIIKMTCFIIAFAIVFNISFPIFASANNEYNIGNVISNEEEIFVDDGEGNQVKVTIIENIYLKSNNKEGDISINGLNPDYPVGTLRSYEIKISNLAMGLPSIVGGGITLAAKMKAAQIAGAAITAKLGSNFIPGLNIVTWIAGAAAWINALTGYEGIKIFVDLKYESVYLHKEGYFMYGWSAKNISISRY